MYFNLYFSLEGRKRKQHVYHTQIIVIVLIPKAQLLLWVWLFY